MAKKKSEEAVVDDLEGTVEGLARDHFLRDVAEAEARTGIKCNYYWPDPLTRTPIPKPDESREPGVGSEEPADEAEGEG